MARKYSKEERAETRKKNQEKFYREREILAKERQARREALAAPALRVNKSIKYTAALAEEICDRVAGGEAISSMCIDKHMPNYVTVYRWLNTYSAFREAFDKARELSAHFDAERINRIAAASLVGDVESDAARVAMQAYQWTASRRNAKMYGDKTPQGGDPSVPPVLNMSLTGVEKDG